jgi:hypothetical protein
MNTRKQAVKDRAVERLYRLKCTHQELVKILQSWLLQTIDFEWTYFLTGSSVPYRIECSVWSRIAVIRSLLTNQIVQQTTREAWDSYGTQVDSKLWRIFLDGDEPQWLAVRNAISRRHNRLLAQRECQVRKEGKNCLERWTERERRTCRLWR